MITERAVFLLLVLLESIAPPDMRADITDDPWLITEPRGWITAQIVVCVVICGLPWDFISRRAMSVVDGEKELERNT